MESTRYAKTILITTLLLKRSKNFNFFSHFSFNFRSFVDYIKSSIFMHGHWLTLISVLIAGLGGQSLFSLVYLIIGFWMLWQGNNLYAMKNHKATLTKWYIVCGCNLMIMLWKTSLQVKKCQTNFILPYFSLLDAF